MTLTPVTLAVFIGGAAYGALAIAFAQAMEKEGFRVFVQVLAALLWPVVVVLGLLELAERKWGKK